MQNLSIYAGLTRRGICISGGLWALMLPARARASTITVFAAASLTDSMKKIAHVWQARTGIRVILSFGGSNILAQQINRGAKADIFMSADPKWMDFLQKNDRIVDSSRHALLHNRLVLIGNTDSPPITIAPHFNLAGALGKGRLAIANPNAVPAGIYAKAALTTLGVWNSVKGKLAPAENVRLAMMFVSRGEAPYGIVYETDAKVDPTVHVAGVFPEKTHPPITYPVALTRTASPQAKDFLAFLSGTQARAIFKSAGFSPP